MKSFHAFALGLAFAATLPALAAESTDTLGRIKKAAAITVAYSPDSLPFSYTESNGEPMGYSIELCKRVIAQIGRKVGIPNLKVTWLPAPTNQRLDMVAAGKAQMECGNTTETLARHEKVDFSSLIFLDSGGFVGRAADTVARFADAGGKKIAVLKDTTTEARLRAALKARLVNAEVVTIATADEGMAKLASGDVDLYAGDKIKLVGLVVLSPEPGKYRLLSEDLSYEPYALGVPRNDSAFRLEVNRALTQVYAGGDIGAIYGRWLGKLGEPTPILMSMYLLNSIPE